MHKITGGPRRKEQDDQGNMKNTRGTRRKEQESLKHTQTPSAPLAHSTKEVGNKKTKEQEDQGHKMTRGDNQKGTILSGKQEENTITRKKYTR